MAGKKIDLTGKHFGRLTVIEFAGKDKYSNALWKCNCSCGTLGIIINGQSLRRGKTNSCGCIKKEVTSKRMKKDLKGKRFGKLIALREVGKNKKGKTLWECQCDCGILCTAISQHLLCGGKKSCGCLRPIKDLTGQKFGRLTVLEEAGKTKSGGLIWKASCECGTFINVSSYHLIRGDIKSCGCLRKELTSKRTKGKILNKNRFTDLTGKRFGKLTVIKRAGYNKHKQILWGCSCDCGGTTVTTGNALRSGHTKSCGCLHKTLDHAMIGKRFGRLIVIKSIGIDKYGSVLWECNCDCGKRTIVPTNFLNNGHTQSCGCYRLDRAAEANFIDLTGKRFSRLLVLSFAGKKGKNKYLWNCLCDCGNETLIDGGHLRSGQTKSCGCIRGDLARERGKLSRLPPGETAFNYVYAGYKRGAERRKLAFEITKEEFREISQKDCFYCGTSPSREYTHPPLYNGSFVYNGMDRIDNKKGYTKDNVVPSCSNCNYGKRDFSLLEFLDWIKKISENRDILINKLKKRKLI